MNPKQQIAVSQKRMEDSMKMLDEVKIRLQESITKMDEAILSS